MERHCKLRVEQAVFFLDLGAIGQLLTGNTRLPFDDRKSLEEEFDLLGVCRVVDRLGQLPGLTVSFGANFHLPRWMDDNTGRLSGVQAGQNLVVGSPMLRLAPGAFDKENQCEQRAGAG